MTPAWRIPPPKSLRTRRASAMKAFEPATALPTGARRPFEKHVMTESKPAASDASETPSAAAAFHRRAPSRCVAEALLHREGEERFDDRARDDRAAGEVMRVLEGENGRARQVVDRLGPDPRRHLLFRHPAARRVDRARQKARQSGHARHLVMEDVALALEDDFRAGAGVDAQRELVTHRAGRHEESRLLAEYLCRPLLEAPDRRILAVDVVADLRLGHGAPHFRRGLRDGVGPKVGDGRGHARIIPERARRGRGGSRTSRGGLPGAARHRRDSRHGARRFSSKVEDFSS